MKNKIEELHKIGLRIEKFSPCYVIIYKTKRGTYHIYHYVSKEEKKEIKSIIMGLVQNE